MTSQLTQPQLTKKRGLVVEKLVFAESENVAARRIYLLVMKLRSALKDNCIGAESALGFTEEQIDGCVSGSCTPGEKSTSSASGATAVSGT